MEHVALFKWKKSLKKQDKKNIDVEVLTIRHKIDAVMDLCWGDTVHADHAQGYQSILILRLTPGNDLSDLFQHSFYTRVMENFIKPNMRQYLVMNVASPRYIGSYFMQLETEGDDPIENTMDEETRMRRSGSLPIPMDLQPELMERLHHFQHENEKLQNTIAKYKNCLLATTGISGISIMSVFIMYLFKRNQ